MILFGYCYFNKKVGAYSAPQFLNINKEVKVEGDLRAAQMAKPEEKYLYEENDLYYVGQFDDVKGSFEYLDHPEFLCTFNVKENNHE